MSANKHVHLHKNRCCAFFWRYELHFAIVREGHHQDIIGKSKYKLAANATLWFQMSCYFPYISFHNDIGNKAIGLFKSL